MVPKQMSGLQNRRDYGVDGLLEVAFPVLRVSAIAVAHTRAPQAVRACTTKRRTFRAVVGNESIIQCNVLVSVEL